MTTIGPIGRPSNVVANQVPDSLARGYIPPPDTTDESLIGLARGDVILEIANQQVDPDGDWVETIKPGHVTGISKVADELPEGNGDSPVREPPRVEGQTLWWVPTPWSEVNKGMS